MSFVVDIAAAVAWCQCTCVLSGWPIWGLNSNTMYILWIYLGQLGPLPVIQNYRLWLMKWSGTHYTVALKKFHNMLGYLSLVVLIFWCYSAVYRTSMQSVRFWILLCERSKGQLSPLLLYSGAQGMWEAQCHSGHCWLEKMCNLTLAQCILQNYDMQKNMLANSYLVSPISFFKDGCRTTSRFERKITSNIWIQWQWRGNWKYLQQGCIWAIVEKAAFQFVFL